MATTDLLAIVRGFTHAVGERGQTGRRLLRRRSAASMFGYLERMAIPAEKNARAMSREECARDESGARYARAGSCRIASVSSPRAPRRRGRRPMLRPLSRAFRLLNTRYREESLQGRNQGQVAFAMDVG